MNDTFDFVIRNTTNVYFQTSFCLCVFMDNDVLSGTFEGLQIIMYSTDNINAFVIEHKCDGIFINGDDPKSIFEAIERRILHQNDTRVKNNFRKYLIFVGDGERGCLDIFQSKHLNFVTDVLNICYMKHAGDEYALLFYTHKYVGSGGNDAVLLDKWFSKNSTFLFGNGFNPDKLSDQEGRILRVATFIYGPYTLADIKHGTELSLITEFARRHNNSLKIIVNNNELWGDTFSNFSGTGVFGQVVMDEADIGFCAIFYWLNNYWYIDYSQYYVRTGVTCLVPSPSVFFEWTDVFPNLSGHVCLVIVIILPFCGLILYLDELLDFLLKENTPSNKLKFNSIKVIKHISWSLLQISLVIPATIITKSKLKFLYVCLYLTAIIMYTIYIGSFSSKLTAPRYKDSIDTIHQLAARNVIWIGSQADAWIGSIRHDESESYQTVVRNFREFNQIEEYTNNDAFAAERLMSGYFVIDDTISLNMLQHLQIMEEDLYSQYTTFIARKNSVLLPVLNDFILRAVSAGLHLYWESQAIISSNIKKQATLLSVKTPREYRLGMSHLQGLFYVWLIGCTAAAIIFILEISINYNGKY